MKKRIKNISIILGAIVLASVILCCSLIFYINYMNAEQPVDFVMIIPIKDNGEKSDIAHVCDVSQQIFIKDSLYKKLDEDEVHELKISGSNFEKGELLGYVIRESDRESFMEEHPDTYFTIDNSVYYIYDKNRLKIYSLVGYEEEQYLGVEGPTSFFVYVKL